MKIEMRFPWYLFNSCEILSGSKSVRMVFSKNGIIGRASYHILPLFLLKYEIYQGICLMSSLSGYLN